MKHAKEVLFAVVICATSKLASPQTSQDPYALLCPAEKGILKPAIERYAHDQANQNWVDLWEIYDQSPDIEFKRDTGRPDDAPPLEREQFAKAWQELISSGSMPHLTKLQVIEVHSTAKGFIIRDCGEVKRENFHFKGLLDIEAHF